MDVYLDLAVADGDVVRFDVGNDFCGDVGAELVGAEGGGEKAVFHTSARP